MIDKVLLADRIAAVRDAVARIREFLPRDVADFEADRTAREVVVLNLFVALQECLSLSTHWLADAGWEVPSSYRDAILALVEHGVIERALGERLASAAGLRNLIGHRYGAVDWRRIHEIASNETGDLLDFCAALARAAQP